MHGFAFPQTFNMFACVWPGAILPDFYLGLAAATGVRSRCLACGPETLTGGGSGSSDESSRSEDDKEARALQKRQGMLADTAALAIVLPVLFIPQEGSEDCCRRWCTGGDTMLARALVPLFAAFLFCADGRGEGSSGLVAQLLHHKALAGVGMFALEAILLQGPIFGLFEVLLEPQMKISAEGFFAAFLTVWLVAGSASHLLLSYALPVLLPEDLAHPS